MEEKQLNTSQTGATHKTANNDAYLKSFLSMFVPIAVAIVICNVLVFALFARKRILRTPSNMFLLSLSISDCANGLVNIPLFLSVTFVFQTWECRTAVLVLHNFTLILTAYHILVITAERFFAIMKPFKRRSSLSKSFAVRVILAVWLVSGVIAAIEVPIHVYDSPTFGKIYLLVYFLAAFVLPFLFMFYAFVVMFCTLRKRKCVARHRKDIRTYKKLLSDWKCLLIFTTMLVVFLICWCPSYVIRMVIIVFAREIWTYSPHFPKVLESFTIIRYVSSVLNPLLYTMLKADFINALRTFRRSRYNSDRSKASSYRATLTNHTQPRLSVSEKFNGRKSAATPKHVRISLTDMKQGNGETLDYS